MQGVDKSVACDKGGDMATIDNSDESDRYTCFALHKRVIVLHSLLLRMESYLILHESGVSTDTAGPQAKQSCNPFLWTPSSLRNQVTYLNCSDMFVCTYAMYVFQGCAE